MVPQPASRCKDWGGRRLPAAFVADLRGEPLETLAAATTANFFRLFGRAQQ